MQVSVRVISCVVVVVIYICPVLRSFRLPRDRTSLRDVIPDIPSHRQETVGPDFTGQTFHKETQPLLQHIDLSRENMLRVIRTELWSKSARTFYDNHNLAAQHKRNFQQTSNDDYRPTELFPMPEFPDPFRDNPDITDDGRTPTDSNLEYDEIDDTHIEKPACWDMKPFNKFMCPTPDYNGQYRCIPEHAICDRRQEIDCPNGEDEDPAMCLLHKWIFDYISQIGDDVSDEINYLDSQVERLSRQLVKLNKTVNHLQQIGRSRGKVT